MKQYKRLTNQKWSEDIDLTQELGYSHIYKRLHELEDKIENKVLMELPCKIGDTIYYANIFAPALRIEEYIVTGIKIFANELLRKISTQIECYPVKDGPCSFGKYIFNDSDIFTTRAKAKQELEKMQKVKQELEKMQNEQICSSRKTI